MKLELATNNEKGSLGRLRLKRRPEWLRLPMRDPRKIVEVRGLLRELGLHTVCESANCPNIAVCFGRGTATFMIMGDSCTRNCRFCGVHHGRPQELDLKEPDSVAVAVKRLGLKHAVVTSVTRDDLPDYGASHFANTMRQIKRINPGTTVEALIPDLMGTEEHIRTVVESGPQIINHNLETVRRLSHEIRPEADYDRSLKVLRVVKELDDSIYTKSGIMVGLGEAFEEVVETMKDLRGINCQIFTIGQYLQPSSNHAPIVEYVRPETYDRWKLKGLEMGFLHVNAGPLVRSSFNADMFQLVRAHYSTSS